MIYKTLVKRKGDPDAPILIFGSEDRAITAEKALFDLTRRTLSHSSITAREYGIPAVLATGNGPRRIKDGQLITVDGGLGVVCLN